jgi:2-dehydropantoate 2-reductase
MSNGVSAITGMGGKALAMMPAARRLSIQLGGEAIAVGHALGFQMGPIQGSDPKMLLAAAGGDAAALEAMEKSMQERAQRMSEEALASTAQDMMKGRRTEISSVEQPAHRPA